MPHDAAELAQYERQPQRRAREILPPDANRPTLYRLADDAASEAVAGAEKAARDSYAF